MPDVLDDFYAEKQSIVNEMFIATADHNYVLARWSFHQDLNVDFFWLAVHSIEKYLKAVLLMNGKSTHNFGHKISQLYRAVTPLAPELFPTYFTKPTGMPVEYWHNETVEKFVDRLYRNGQADNRYQLFGHSRHPEDLWKLDQTVFSIRRACRTLEAYELGRPFPNAANMSNREVLGKHPTRWRLNSKLEDTMSGKHGDELLKASLVWNFPFAPPDYNQPPMTYTSSIQSPVLARRLFDPLEAGPQEFAHNDALWDWVKNNISPKKSLKRLKRGAIKSRRRPTAHNLALGGTIRLQAPSTKI